MTLPRWTLKWILPLALLGIWVTVSEFGLADPRFVVPLQKIAAAPFEPLVWPLLSAGLPASLVRFFFGSIIGILLGVAFGTLLAVSRGVDRSVSPTFHALRQVAIFAWVPLLTAWLGMGESAKIVFIALAAFKSMSMNTYQGARHVPPHYVEVGRALCFSRWGMFSRVVLPAALPSILTGIRLALLHAWAATVGVEYLLGLGDGVGVLLTEGRERFRMDIVIFGVLLVGGVGLLINLVPRLVAHRLVRWKEIEI